MASQNNETSTKKKTVNIFNFFQSIQFVLFKQPDGYNVIVAIAMMKLNT